MMLIEHFNQLQNISSFSSTPGTFNKIDYIPNHTISLNKFKSNAIKPYHSSLKFSIIDMVIKLNYLGGVSYKYN